MIQWDWDINKEKRTIEIFDPVTGEKFGSLLMHMDLSLDDPAGSFPWENPRKEMDKIKNDLFDVLVGN